jgi:hypothetical protein
MRIDEWMNVWKLVSAVGMEADISERFYGTIQTYSKDDIPLLL